jgi:hypothetical protein
MVQGRARSRTQSLERKQCKQYQETDQKLCHYLEYQLHTPNLS